MRRFDLALFRSLQDEYSANPIVTEPRGLDGDALAHAAERRIDHVIRRIGSLEGARVLEIGCGRGYVSRLLADKYGCHTVGVDVLKSDSWAERPDLQFHRHDVATAPNGFLGKFDLILSFAVWEHVEHPFAALSACRAMLEDDGRKYLYANLYRGPKASHLYRELFFPWPHLLFQDDVISRYYHEDLAIESSGAAWVNKLTAAQYLTYFNLLKFDQQQVWWSKPNFDFQFYERFEDVLGRYPVFDLQHDFIHAVLTPGEGRTQTDKLEEEIEVLKRRTRSVRRQRDRARERAAEIRMSRSWRVTAPMRRVMGILR